MKLIISYTSLQYTEYICLGYDNKKKLYWVYACSDGVYSDMSIATLQDFIEKKKFSKHLYEGIGRRVYFVKSEPKTRDIIANIVSSSTKAISALHNIVQITMPSLIDYFPDPNEQSSIQILDDAGQALHEQYDKKLMRITTLDSDDRKFIAGKKLYYK